MPLNTWKSIDAKALVALSRNMPEHVGRCGSCHHHTRVLWWDIPPNPREDREEGLIDDYAT